MNFTSMDFLRGWEENLPDEADIIKYCLEFAEERCHCHERYEVLGQNGDIFCLDCFVSRLIGKIQEYESETSTAWSEGFEEGLSAGESSAHNLTGVYSLQQLRAAWAAGRHSRNKEDDATHAATQKESPCQS